MLIGDKTTNPIRLHTARWVVPVSLPLLENGAIATFKGKILDIGSAPELCSRYGVEIKDYGDSILCPALVNAHSHLELSPLKYSLLQSNSFADWIRVLVEARKQISVEEYKTAIYRAMREMHENGIIAVGDIGNLDLVPIFYGQKEKRWPLKGIFFHELVCPIVNEAEEITSNLSDISQKISENFGTQKDSFPYAFSAHAPYSVAPQVLQAIKTWDQNHSMPFPIHLAESEEEIDFLQNGKGPIKELLAEKGHWPLNYNLPRVSPVEYLEILGVLDKNTVCIHCVHVNQNDISILAKTGASVCLCPRSNIFLGVGIPPAEELYAAGVPLAIGTDSLASNDQLSVFTEMASLSQLAPSLSPEAIFRAATYGGAQALGMSKKLGSLASGKSANFLVINSGPINSKDVFEFLVREVNKELCNWIIG
jgi:cytosine/adenosine deaminase-related metal-dependent hydrolase